MQLCLQNSFIFFLVQNHITFRKVDALVIVIFCKKAKKVTICKGDMLNKNYIQLHLQNSFIHFLSTTIMLFLDNLIHFLLSKIICKKSKFCQKDKPAKFLQNSFIYYFINFSHIKCMHSLHLKKKISTYSDT